MLRRTRTYWLLITLFMLTGAYAFWLFSQWNDISAMPGANLDVIRRNAFLSLTAGFICVAGVVALTIAHIRHTRSDI